MKIQVILEILVVLAVIAFASSRVIDSRDDISDFTGRLIKNVTKNPKDRQNEIVVGGDYEDDLNSNVSGEISVGEDDLINSQQISSSNDVNTAISGEENNILNSVPEVTDLPVNIDDAHPLNRYCTCNEIECNCCREFKLPLVSVRGPGCATVRYLGKNKMSVSIKYGDITLTSRTISGRKARPICLNLPGGYSQFCGRVYGINRDDEDFKACLGLELRAEDEVEAALRVSCFQFGPRGLKMTDPEPLPPVVDAADEDDEGGSDILSLIAGGGEDEDTEDEDDDSTGDEDTDILGFADDDDDSEDDDDDDLDDDDDDGGLPAASDDYPSGFSLLDGLFDTDSGNKKKKVTQNRNKVPSGNSEEDIKANNVGTKVKIPNSPAILSSAAISQNEIDSTLTKDQIADEVKIEKPVVVVKPVEPVKGVEEIKPATPAIEVPTTPKPKKKQTSLLDTLESLIGGDDDDDDDDDDEDAKDEAEEEQEDDEDDEEDAKDDEEEEEEDEEDAKEEEEEEDDDEEEENDDEDDESVAALDKITNDKEELADTDKIKKTKKKTDFGFGLLNFARLLKLI